MSINGICVMFKTAKSKANDDYNDDVYRKTFQSAVNDLMPGPNLRE